MRCPEPGGSVAVALVASRALCPSGRTRCAWVVRPLHALVFSGRAVHARHNSASN